MKFFKYTFIIPASLFLMGCPVIPGPPAPTDGGVKPPKRTEEEYKERNKKRAEAREKALKKARKGKQCKDNDKCEDKCDDLYKRRADENRCVDRLSIAQVDKLEELYEVLEDADLDELEDIEIDDLDVLLNISIEPLDDLVGDYNRKKAREFLVWIAKDADAAKILEKEDDDYKILKELLGTVSSVSGSNYLPSFKANIDGGETFFDILTAEKNNEAFEWAQQFIDNNDSKCENNTESENCFTVYCDIAKSMDSDRRGDLIDFEDFEKYIDGIIERGINGSANPSSDQWDTDDFEDAGDLNDDWDKELCGGLV